jgi:hypothetical protein
MEAGIRHLRLPGLLLLAPRRVRLSGAAPGWQLDRLERH